MKAVVQRVRRARVIEVESAGPSAVRTEALLGEIGLGMLVLLGLGPDDSAHEVEWLADKLAHLRIFPDAADKMNCSLLEAGGSVLLVSQFTLYGDCRRGRRPSFTGAMAPERARPLFERAAQALRERGLPTATGRFGAHMEVELVNDGPVTLLLESDGAKRGGGV